MTKDPLLRSAVKAIKQKVQNAAPTSTPEELAYLATAVERIGGRASLLEMEELGDVKQAEFVVLAGQTQKGVTDAIEAKRIATEKSITDTTAASVKTMTDTKTAAEKSVNDTTTAAKQDLGTSVAAGTKTIDDTKAAAVKTMTDTQTATVAAVAKAANDAAKAANALVLTPAKLLFLCQN